MIKAEKSFVFENIVPELKDKKNNEGILALILPIVLNLIFISIIASAITAFPQDIATINAVLATSNAHNITNSLETILNQTQTNELTHGYVCIPVINSTLSENGYRCEPCDLYPGLCEDFLSRFDKS